jgi:type VI secretion system protein ImpE
MPRTATELFLAGRLRDAIDAQVGKVKAAPDDQSDQLFLFELYLFAGELDRGRFLLDQLRSDDPKDAAAVERFRRALDAESHRRAVFAGHAHPKALVPSPEHVRLRLEALPYLARGEHPEACKRFAEANAAGPVAAGTLNGRPHAGLCDADERFGTVLEVFAPGGAYCWVPLEQVQNLTLSPPQSPRDVIWRAAQLSLVGGEGSDVLLPGLYPDTHQHADDDVRLGRATEWDGEDGEVARGSGGRLYLTADAAYRFVDLSDLRRAAD